eukprot:3346307-Amphidinium_carterae.1
MACSLNLLSDHFCCNVDYSPLKEIITYFALSWEILNEIKAQKWHSIISVESSMFEWYAHFPVPNVARSQLGALALKGTFARKRRSWNSDIACAISSRKSPLQAY